MTRSRRLPGTGLPGFTGSDRGHDENPPVGADALGRQKILVIEDDPSRSRNLQARLKPTAMSLRGRRTPRRP